jgi:hypothetical protein
MNTCNDENKQTAAGSGEQQEKEDTKAIISFQIESDEEVLKHLNLYFPR